MKMKKFYGAMMVSLLASVATAQIPYSITGTWKNGAGQKVHVTHDLSGKKDTINHATVDDKGCFSLQGEVDIMKKMTLCFGEKSSTEFFADGEPITAVIIEKTKEKNGKTSTFRNAEIQGSRQQDVLKQGNELAAASGLLQLGKMFSLSNAQKQGQAAFDSVMNVFNKMDSALNASIAMYMDTTRNDYASTCFFSFLMQNESFEKISGHYGKLTDKVKQSSAGLALKKDIDQMQTVSIGGTAPNIKLPAPDGTEFSLYSLRGHIVLLDFWAAWCGPCLREMPNVKAIYEKYHDKGLEILGVSLDEKKEAWTAAIEKHALKWHHVSSLKGWKCPIASLFKVTGIPRMYILDKNGKIIAQDLRGEELVEKMDELFAK